MNSLEAYSALFRVNDLMGEHFPESVKEDDDVRRDMDLIIAFVKQSVEEDLKRK